MSWRAHFWHRPVEAQAQLGREVTMLEDLVHTQADCRDRIRLTVL